MRLQDVDATKEDLIACAQHTRHSRHNHGQVDPSRRSEAVVSAPAPAAYLSNEQNAREVHHGLELSYQIVISQGFGFIL